MKTIVIFLCINITTPTTT